MCGAFQSMTEKHHTLHSLDWRMLSQVTLYISGPQISWAIFTKMRFLTTQVMVRIIIITRLAGTLSLTTPDSVAAHERRATSDPRYDPDNCTIVTYDFPASGT